MKEFRCLVGLKHPPGPLAAGVRDWMDRVAPDLENVERISTLRRAPRDSGGLGLVNEWRVNPPIPPALSPLITDDMLGWLDHAEWTADLSACSWRIEPFFMNEAIDCQGATRFEPAMGGRGSRVTFEGRLDIDPAALATLPAVWRAPASLAVEMLIGTLIPRNFRKTVEAVAGFLEAEAQPTSAP